MDLTGAPLVIVLVVLALGVFSWVVIDRPRPRRTDLRLAARAAKVVLLNVIVLSLFGVLLNNQYLFYSSWSDVFGWRSTHVVNHVGGTPHDVIAGGVAGPGLRRAVVPRTLPPLPSPGSRTQDYVVTDRYAGSGAPVIVHLPVGYDAKSPRRYPVIVGLHGFPGGPGAFARLSFLSTVDALTATHRLAPSIVVMPRINTPASLDTECVDGGPGQPQTDTWLSRDLPAWVVQHFRVQLSRTSWVTTGYSYGAWCAASLSMRHPDVYGGAIVLLGYFRPDFGSAYDPLSPAAIQGYDLINRARHNPPPVALWVLTSREDSLSFPTTSRFISVARRPLDVTATVLAHGGHRDAVFLPFVPDAFAWLGRTLPGFHA